MRYLWDQAGVYAGTFEPAQPGVFPANSTDIAPGTPSGGNVMVWAGNQWKETTPPPHVADAAQPRELTALQFILYVGQVLLLGPAAIKAKIEAVPDVAAIWPEVNTVERDNEATSAFLALLVGGGQLVQAEADAIIANWPTG